MHLRSDSFPNGGPMPADYAFASRGQPLEFGGNRSPHLAWRDAPVETRGFVITCIDSDVPSRPDDVNKTDREVPASLPRVEFAHWLMANVPPECGELGPGSCSDGVAVGGKQAPPGPPGVVQGRNDFTGWFAGDPRMAGNYLGYDGPCPPWNDSLVHHYHFTVHALDRLLALEPGFDLAALRAAMDGHVLARAEWVGTYTLNDRLARRA
ncbi:MAG TPA: YbhB/YbcL family Raf kinase inhibitor-like protein [Rhodanobacteraceae bacterium]|nr:YbhB/YbcL family Raf kinase inhibitor-like protein [Rhodanobacteraceae bacterium]